MVNHPPINEVPTWRELGLNIPAWNVKGETDAYVEGPADVLTVGKVVWWKRVYKDSDGNVTGTKVKNLRVLEAEVQKLPNGRRHATARVEYFVKVAELPTGKVGRAKSGAANAGTTDTDGESALRAELAEMRKMVATLLAGGAPTAPTVAVKPTAKPAAAKFAAAKPAAAKPAAAPHKATGVGSCHSCGQVSAKRVRADSGSLLCPECADMN